MKIIVRAKASARTTAVERLTQATLGFSDQPIELDIYKVSVKEPAVDGKANEAIAKALATYFDVAPSLVRLVSGQTSKRKVFEIGD
jgi:uncharacterized protein YggU (UPF0235/DUF167 family)